jgi:AcrR family transcriptional regulator
MPAPRDPEATRQRVVDAARTHFADHGLAGARIDSIAALAHTSKERIYANFRTKEELFQTVLATSVEEWLTAVPFTVDDLAGYGAALFDHFCTHAIDARLILWAQLANRTTSGLFDGSEELLEGRQAQVREAQSLGRIDPKWDPEDLFLIIFGVVMSWLINPALPSVDVVSATEQRGRRDVVVMTIGKLLAP